MNCKQSSQQSNDVCCGCLRFKGLKTEKEYNRWLQIDRVIGKHNAQWKTRLNKVCVLQGLSKKKGEALQVSLLAWIQDFSTNGCCGEQNEILSKHVKSVLLRWSTFLVDIHRHLQRLRVCCFHNLLSVWIWETLRTWQKFLSPQAFGAKLNSFEG